MEVKVNDNAWKDFYPVGMNMGLSIPGTSPGEHAASPEQIRGWLEATADIGCNVVRVYTVLSPDFYTQLQEYNLEHQDNPLFLMHGAWLKEPDEEPADYLADSSKAWFKDEIEKVVDVIYGNRVIPPGSDKYPDNYGRAFGTFESDVSYWLLGFLIGRELEPYTIENSHFLHPEETHYDGDYFSIEGAMPIETFIVEHMDYIVSYEQDKYGRQHTLGFSSWPTLDPLIHYTEPPIPISSEDAFQVDLLKMSVDENAFSKGVFFSYHAYPYYPDFILYQPEYQIEDDEGLNSYLGYLDDLRNHYQGYTLMVAEIGIPSSQGTAHWAESGMHHGGLNEIDAGYEILRSLKTIMEADLNGAMIFSIIDEWFKRAWVVDEVDFPTERRMFWHNVMSPEQNFGLIALHPGEDGDFHTIDGKDDDWDTGPLAQKSSGLLQEFDSYDDMRKIKSLRVDHDAGHLHLLLNIEDLDPDDNNQVDWDKVDYWLAFDTIDPARGDSRLDIKGVIKVKRRTEFILKVSSDSDVKLYVDKPYDLYGLWQGFRENWQKYKTVANDNGNFNIVRTIVNAEYPYEDEILGEQLDQITGELPTGRQEDNSFSNFWYSKSGNFLEIRIPWNLLNFTDPSLRSVVDGDGIETSVTTSQSVSIGIAAISLFEETEGETDVIVADTLPHGEASGESWLIPSEGWADYTWNTWEVPTYHEYKKESYYIVREYLDTVVPDSGKLD